MDYIKIGNLKFSRGVLFILPGILFFGIMVIYPAGYVIYLSLFTEEFREDTVKYAVIFLLCNRVPYHHRFVYGSAPEQ